MEDQAKKYDLQDVLTGVSLLRIINDLEARIAALEAQNRELSFQVKKQTRSTMLIGGQR